MKTTLTIATLVLAGSAFSFTFNDIKLWSGSGANQAALVIDFSEAGVPAFAWGHRFDGSITGLALAQAIDAADSSLSMTTQDFGSFGIAITGFAYNSPFGNLSRSGFSNGSYLSYWLVDDSSTPSGWASSNVGASSRQINGNDWDGWKWGNGSVTPTANVVAAVPEPMTLLALAPGCVALIRRRKK